MLYKNSKETVSATTRTDSEGRFASIVDRPVHFTIMVDLHLNLNLASNRTKTSIFCIE